MSALFKLGSKISHSIFRSSGARRKLRALGMSVLTFPAYVDHKKRRLVQGRADLSEEDKTMLSRVDSRISKFDTMFEGDVASYFLKGLSGLQAAEAALEYRRQLPVNAILDLPCGCGRVGRFLAARFPEATITACDLMREGVDFCAQELGMLPFHSQPDFDRISFDVKFDLIWCGSLVTHLDGKAVPSLLRCLQRHLADNGVAIFTAHGDYVANRLNEGHDYGIGREAASKAVEMYRDQGVVFMPYLGNTQAADYGFSMTSSAWIRRQCGLIEGWKEVYFKPQGWDNHQDVYAYERCQLGSG
jgi:SAM-dependent methyltransferase